MNSHMFLLFFLNKLETIFEVNFSIQFKYLNKIKENNFTLK